MGKDFIEYKSESGMVPYSAATICFCLTDYAKKYIKEEHKLIKNIAPEVRDAVLVDAINYLGAVAWCDFGLYTSDLYDNKKHDDYVETQILLTLLQNHYANYIFKQDLVKSVLRNNHMNKCTEEFNINDGVLVIVDFINYIARTNEYDRVFTIGDLYEKYKIQKHNIEMKQLRKFLESTSKYNKRIIDGQSINYIYNKIIDEDKTKDIKIDEEFNALAYAFAKLKTNEKSQIPVIDKKILEMKKR